MCHVISRENTVIGAFLALSVLLVFLLTEVTDSPTWASAAVVLAAGVVAPIAVNEALDRRGA